MQQHKHAARKRKLCHLSVANDCNCKPLDQAGNAFNNLCLPTLWENSVDELAYLPLNFGG